VPGRMLAYDIDHWRARPPRVVEIRDAVRQAWAQVEEGHCRRRGDSPIPVCRPCADTLEKAENRLHALDRVQCGNQGYLRGPRVSKTYVYAAGGRGLKDQFSAVHVHTASFAALGQTSFVSVGPFRRKVRGRYHPLRRLASWPVRHKPFFIPLKVR